MTMIVSDSDGLERMGSMSPQEDVAVLVQVVIQHSTATNITSMKGRTRLCSAPTLSQSTQTTLRSTSSQMRITPRVMSLLHGSVSDISKYIQSNSSDISLSECSEQHNGYEEFANQVRSGIKRGLNNDIFDFSKRPGIPTTAARRRVTQFQNNFIRIFNAWYKDVTEASQKNQRKCLTDNFPYDSPGNLSKDSVLESMAQTVNSEYLD